MSCNEDNDIDVYQATTGSGRKKKEYSVKFKLGGGMGKAQPEQRRVTLSSLERGNSKYSFPKNAATKLDGSEDALIHCLKEGNGMPDGVASLVQARQQAHAQDLSAELMQGVEVEAPEDPEDDAGNDSDVSVISAEDQAAEESEEFEEEEDSDSEF
ncbi:hypothetical protein AAVH_35234 [Aphelenchoides avenae]|nr:hypothetical protein AAVH_35234 [Aphelenchus avenae]